MVNLFELSFLQISFAAVTITLIITDHFLQL